MNKVYLIGNLVRDSEHRATGTGTSVCTFSLAVNRRFTNQDGKKEADFISIVAFKGLADNCIKFLRKGSQVAVSGSLQTRTYEKDGKKQYITEVVADEVSFLSKKEEGFSDTNDNPFSDEPVMDSVPF
jgi:single-strand DNA-binding protein